MIYMDGLRPSTVGDVLYQTFRLTSIDICAEHPGRFLSVPACAAGSGDVPPFHTGSSLHALLPREAFLRWALPCFSAGTQRILAVGPRKGLLRKTSGAFPVGKSRNSEMSGLPVYGGSERYAACGGGTAALQRNIARQTARGYAQPHVSFVQPVRLTPP